MLKSINTAVTHSIAGHRKKRHELLMNAMSLNKEIWIHVDTLYDETRVSSKGQNSTIQCANISILTKDMLNYDEESFSKNNEYFQYYRPYFIKFCAYNVKGNMLAGRLGKWYYARFVGKKEEFQNSSIIEGEVEYSASPIRYRRRRLYIEEDELSDNEKEAINRTYDLSTYVQSINNIKIVLDGKFKGVSFQYAEIFKVGNGNLILISGQDSTNQGFSMLYDIGYHQRSYKHRQTTKPRIRYNNAIMKLKHLKPKIVILSHWDDDHIMGCAYAENDVYKCPWFAPNVDENTSLNARRVARYVAAKSKLYLVARTGLPKIVYKSVTPKSSIGIYMGAAIGSQSRSNCEGMIIDIRNRNNNYDVESLFHGDVPYRSASSKVWKYRPSGIDYLVVPHHGGKMDTSPLVKKKEKGIAIVCGDNSPGYRPNNNHKNDLISANYEVKVTEEIPDDKCTYQIDLCEKGKLSIK